MVDKREMEQAQLVETADERGRTRMSGAAHRRESACIGGCLPTAVRGSLYRLLARTKFTKWSNFCVIAGAGLEFSLQAALTGAG